MKMLDPVYLDPDLLEKVWSRFIKEHNLYSDRPYFARLAPRHPMFCNTTSYTPERKKFEAWLFEHGGSVRRISKKYYLEFAIQDKAMFFALQYA